jgi:hypothetical protein
MTTCATLDRALVLDREYLEVFMTHKITKQPLGSGY